MCDQSTFFCSNPPIALVGKYTEIVISSNVTNNEENAYQTLLVVQYPKSVSYINVKEGVSVFTCLPGKFTFFL